MKKRIAAGLLALAMVFSLVMGSGWIKPEAETAEAAESELTLPASGTSNQVEWSIDENGHLEINGTGDWERQGIDAPWEDYKLLITSAKATLSGATDLSHMFNYCRSLTSLDVSGFDTSNVTDMRSMFSDCSSLTSLDVSSFDTSSVTDMGGMFEGCNSLTSLDISGFDTSNVTDMGFMFNACSGLTSLDVSGFDTSNVTDMHGMFGGSIFGGCGSLASLDVSGFDTSSVTDMGGMFADCSSLTSLDVSGFDTSSVTYMQGMFSGCGGLTSLDVSGFDTSNVTQIFSMFEGCSGLTSLDLSSFDMQNVIKYANNFINSSSLTSIHAPLHVKTSIALPGEGVWKDEKNNIYEYLPENLDTSIVLRRYANADDPADPSENDKTEVTLPASGTSNQVEWSIDENGYLEISGTGNWERRDGGVYAPWHDYAAFITSAKVTLSGAGNLSYMFFDCDSLTSLDVSGFNTSSATSMDRMFSRCSGLTSLAVSSFDTSNVTNMREMFSGCSNLTGLDVSGFDTSSVTLMYGMFNGCSSLTSLDVSGFDISNVTDMYHMFRDCSSLTSLDVSSFDTSNVTDMYHMFRDCSSLTSLDVSSFDTSNVTDMGGLFKGCSSLTSLDLSSFDMQNVKYADDFIDCSSLNSIHTPLHVKISIALPHGSVWKDEENNIYEYLPLNLDTSIVLRRDTDADDPSEDDKKDEDKTDEEKIAEAKTVLEEALPEIKVDNAATVESIQSLIEKLLNEAGITGVTVTVDDFEKVEATNDSEGSMTATVTLTAGSESYTTKIEKAIEKLSNTDNPDDPSEDDKKDEDKTDAEKIAEAKTALEEALPEIKVDNAATEESIQSAIEKLLNEAGITSVKVTVDDFKKVEATNDSEGMLTAAVTLTAANESYKLEINKTIAKLQKTDADNPTDLSDDNKDDNKTDTENTSNPSGDNKGGNATDTGNSATPANSSGNSANANNKTNPANAANAADSTKTAESSEIPARKMGDETNVLLYILLAIASAVGAGCAMRRMQSKCSKV